MPRILTRLILVLLVFQIIGYFFFSDHPTKSNSTAQAKSQKIQKESLSSTTLTPATPPKLEPQKTQWKDFIKHHYIKAGLFGVVLLILLAFIFTYSYFNRL